MDAQFISTILCGGVAILAAAGAILLSRYFADRLPKDAATLQPAENPYQAPVEIAHAMDTSMIENPSSRSPGALMVPIATVIAGTVLGVVSRWLRPYLDIEGVHYEALGALIILILSCLGLVIYHCKLHGSLTHQLYQLETIALWAGFACGWSLVHGYFWGDLIGVAIAWWLGCAISGSLVLALRQRFRSR